MSKEEFIKLLEFAKEDENGNLYFEDKILTSDDNSDAHRVYFGTITTICGDLIKEHSNECDGYREVYNRHFWNDDTLEIKIVNKNKGKEIYEETKVNNGDIK